MTLLWRLKLQTDVTMNDVSNLETDNLKRQQLLRVTSVPILQGNKWKLVTFYTGLCNFTILIAIFVFMKIAIRLSDNNKLTLFSFLIITLMKLCLNLNKQDITYHVGVSQSTISRTVKH